MHQPSHVSVHRRFVWEGVIALAFRNARFGLLPDVAHLPRDLGLDTCVNT